MKKLKLTKAIASSLIVASVFALNPIGASAEWKNNSKGWWYTEGNSYYTGWKLIDNNWYYFYSDGYMAKDTWIDGYYLNTSGAWTTDTAGRADTSLNGLEQQILQNLNAQNTSFDVECSGGDEVAGREVDNAWDNLKYTHPYEVYNAYGVSISSGGGSNIATIHCGYRISPSMESELDAQVRSVIASITSNGMSQLEKERAIHDWIVNNTVYDESFTIHDAYNTFFSHTGVCEGYSLLAYKMFTVAGIESLVVTGTATNSLYSNGGHAWNMVHIDGKWRHVDCTWDDPIGDEDVLRYDYYNLTDSQMSKDHTWDKSKYPRTN